MKVLPPAILFFEAVVVALAIPVAVTTAGRGAAAAWWFAALALLLLLAAGMARKPRGVAIGWVLQVAVIASGLLVPAMLVLGLIFLAVWMTALYYGAKGDRIAAANRARAASESPVGASSAAAVPTGPRDAAPAARTTEAPVEPVRAEDAAPPAAG